MAKAMAAQDTCYDATGKIRILGRYASKENNVKSEAVCVERRRGRYREAREVRSHTFITRLAWNDGEYSRKWL